MNKKLAIKKKTVFKMRNKGFSDGDSETLTATASFTSGLTFSSLL